MAEIISLNPDTDYLVSAGGVVSSAGAEATGRRLVTIHNGKIESVLEATCPIPARFTAPSCQRHDVGEAVLHPAFIDSHVHLGIRAASDPEQGISQCLCNGIAAVRDGGDPWAATLLGKGRLSQLGIQIHASGWAIHHRDGYGRFLGKGIASHEDFEELLSTPTMRGADFVKIIVSGIVDFETGALSGPTIFQQADLRRMVESAARRGLWVMAHANSDPAIRASVMAGVRSIEHGLLITRDAVKLMADSGVYWTPTLLPVFNLGRSNELGLKAPSRIAANVQRIYRQHEKNVLFAYEAGVKLVAGTDAGVPGIHPGSSLHEELGLMVSAGLSAEAAMQSATVHPAEMLASSGYPSLGSIAPGKWAHLLGLSRLPTGRLIVPEDILFVIAVRAPL